MNYSVEERLDYIKEILKKHGLTLEDFHDFLSRPVENSSATYNQKNENNIIYGDIIGCFIPSMEKISMNDIVGLEFNADNMLDAFLKIYRFDSLYNNLGNFNQEKYENSLKNSNFQLFEKNGKYYVNGDGNHRALLMLFQYNLEIERAKKLGYSDESIQKLRDSLTISAPVIHLKHDNFFEKSIVSTKRISTSISRELSALETDFIHEFLPSNLENDFAVQFNKNTNTYNYFYKGFTGFKKSNTDVINDVKNIDDLDLKNYFLKYGNKYLITQNHFGMSNIPQDKLKKIDEMVFDIELPDMSFEYFAKNTYPNKTFDLCFAGKDYGNISIDFNVLNEFIENNSEILFSNRSDSNEQIFTYQNYLNDLHFKNLSYSQMKKIIDTMERLDTLILSYQTKKTR